MSILLPPPLAPPLAPEPPGLSGIQLRFLQLHASHLVTAWTWHFCETMLQAVSGMHRAYIWRDELESLLREGLMEDAGGCSVRCTELGREAVRPIAKEITA